MHGTLSQAASPASPTTASETRSLAEILAALPEAERAEVLAELDERQAQELLWDWRFWARPKQLPPPGDWATWAIVAGRGFGKTRSGAGWVHERAMQYPGRWIALVARTPADARDYMIEGPGGLLKNVSPDERPHWEPSKRRLSWPNRSWATVYSDEEPDQLRGFSGDTAWLDEFAKFKNAGEGWDNLQFGMREASTDRPRRLITTTPRPISALKEILAMPTTRVVVGSSHENRANLDPTWYRETLKAYEGTRTGRQEVYAEILDDVPGALWTRAMIDTARKSYPVPDMVRVVVAVDPSGTGGDDTEKVGDDVGIVAAGKGVDGHCYVMDDKTCNLSPAGWGRRAVSLYRARKADRIVAERNYGGAMVGYVIRSIDPTVAYSEVSASRGKAVRAEPVAALYEQNRVHHLSDVLMPQLEDELCMMTRDGYEGKGSPNRADALVWAVSELMFGSTYTLANL